MSRKTGGGLSGRRPKLGAAAEFMLAYNLCGRVIDEAVPTQEELEGIAAMYQRVWLCEHVDVMKVG